MCTLLPLLPPLWPPFYAFLELQARLTPFWKARRLTDEIIKQDKKLVREYKRRLQGKTDRSVGLAVTLCRGFYYVWFRHSFSGFPDILTCPPLIAVGPDFIVQKCKLRRDQIEYLERGRLRDNG